MSDTRVKPGLFAALAHFSRMPFDEPSKTAKIFTFDTPLPGGSWMREAWDERQAIGEAFDALSKADSAVAKFMYLKRRMHEHGLGDLYELMMGEKLDLEKP